MGKDFNGKPAGKRPFFFTSEEKGRYLNQRILKK